MARHTSKDLKQMQSLPLEAKEIMSMQRIRAWHDHWDGLVYVSISGGKDSAVLDDLVRRALEPVGIKEVPRVFSDTGLEYPEVRQHALARADVVLRPKMRFLDVLKTYGYPVISKEIGKTLRDARSTLSKGNYSLSLRQLGVRREEYGGLYDSGRYDYDKTVEGSMFNKAKYRPLLDADFHISDWCCEVMKKKPFKEYEKETGRMGIVGTLAEESALRKNSWYKNGCNAFKAKKPQSRPMSFWTEQDVLQYVQKYNLPIASVYGDIVEDEATGKLRTTLCDRTGCIFCGFGCHVERESRFERLKETHPRQWNYCINGGEYDETGRWQPNKKGLGMGHVFDELNKLYGPEFIKYGKDPDDWMK